MLFIDTLKSQDIKDIESNIKDDLYDHWYNNHADEGEDVVEFEFMQFASDDLKQRYNEYYGYIEGDDFLL